MKRAKLIDRCDRLRSHILAREWATEEEIGEWWPKKRDPLDKWMECFGHLRFLMGRAESAQNRIDNADQQLLDALNETPVALPLPELPQTRIYPKSFNALLWFHHKDYAVTVMHGKLDIIDYLIESNDPLRLEFKNIWATREALVEFIGKQTTIMAYAASTPGPSVDKDVVENPPDEWLNLSPQELALVHQAFFDINVRRISLIPYLAIQPRSEMRNKDKREVQKRRLSWSVFGAEMANVFKTDVADILNNRSLTALMAQIRLGSEALHVGL